MASQEKREFDKYLKFLTSKAVQVMIQSHDGTKMSIRSNPEGTDWFNVVLNDSREIVTELKHSLDPPYPQDGRPVTVEISAETTEGESFLVEIWQIIFNTRKRDVTVSVSHSLYPRLSLLLKSVLAVSRCIPSYQLSRKNEDLKFKYVLSSEDPSSLEGLKMVKLGESVGPFGAVSIVLHYRTHFTSLERVSCDPQSVPAVVSPVTGSQRSSDESLPSLIPASVNTPSSHPNAPFSAFLPKPTQRMLSSEKNTPSEEGSLLPSGSRQDSEETNSVTVRSNHDGYLVLDMNDMKPAFSGGDLENNDVSELLMLCTDPPALDMFYEGGMDVSAACSYLDANPSLSASLVQQQR